MMESGAHGQGSESQDSDEPVPPCTGLYTEKNVDSPSTSNSNSSPNPCQIVRGIETAKKKLRAFAIQKKATVPPVALAKPLCTGNTTVLIGKLSSVKVTAKPEKPVDDEKKVPKPPKPGSSKKPNFSGPESYTQLQKKTLSEIEDMKRKMELVELGIPLGLVCPSTNAIPCKAMPTKAMPPIKTFLDTAKIDEIIREARKAKAEGKEFKFDYQKFVPDYDNPFQRKKDSHEFNPPDKKEIDLKEETILPKFDKDRHTDKDRHIDMDKHTDIDRRKSDRYGRKHDYRKDSRDKYKEKDRHREKDRKEEARSKEREDKNKERDIKSRDKDHKHKNEDKVPKKDEVLKDTDKKEIETSINKLQEKTGKESNVNLNEYVVCDSWSLDTEDKNSPQVYDKAKRGEANLRRNTNKNDVPIDPLEQLRQSLGKSRPRSNKMEKLKPVKDSFTYEIDPNDDDDIIDIFEENPSLDKYSKIKLSKDSRDNNSNDSHDDTFLESIINEIKQEDMSSDDECHEKSLVEYDESPVKDTIELSVGSVTPELDDSLRLQSQRSDYSDGYKSSDSRKSIESHRSRESGYKSTESYKSDKNVREFEYKFDSEQGESSFKSTFKSTFKPTEEINVLAAKTSNNESTSKHSDSDHKSRNQCSKDHLSVERDLEVVIDDKMSKDIVDSLETWSFVLKICQPLLFRHDKNKCYKETRTNPKVWYTQNPKLCHCVTDRSVVYQELEMCKMDLVDRLYGCDQITDSSSQVARGWYPHTEKCLTEQPAPLQLSSEWDIEEGQPEAHPLPLIPLPLDRATLTPEKVEEVLLDREYQRFMEAVSWPEPVQDNRSTTPTKEARKATAEDRGHDTRKTESKKIKLSSEGWSQESEFEEDEKIKPAKEKLKEKRKRKLSPLAAPAPAAFSTDSDMDDTRKKRKKTVKKKDVKKAKTKVKRKRIQKKMLKKLKDKKKKKKEKVEEVSEQESEKEIKKKDKKIKKKKQLKVKKKAEKKKKRVRSSSSSSSSSSDSSSESSSESDRKTKKKKKKEIEAKKKKKDKKKKRNQSTSESAQSEELFDMNIVANIKCEKLTDEEIDTALPKKHREIVNVSQLQEHFSSSTVQIKQEKQEEVPEDTQPEPEEEKPSPKLEEEVANKPDSNAVLMDTFDLGVGAGEGEQFDGEDKVEKIEFKEPVVPTPPARADDSSQTSLTSLTSVVSQTSQTSQNSSQESVSSVHSKEPDSERDDSHLRPSSANSNYSFNDVISKSMEHEGMENYDMYEQMAMAYQSDVASQQISPPNSTGEQRIETVVGSRSNNGRGEIKCDWRASDGPLQATHRPSRWGLKPGEVNIVLTGGSDQPERVPPPARPARAAHPARPGPQPVYKIQSLANRHDSSMTYDEAYMDMYGDSDRLTYGDCFSAGGVPFHTATTCVPAPAPAPAPAPIPAASPAPAPAPLPPRARSLDDRINQALKHSVLGEAVKDETVDRDAPEKGILVMKSLGEGRGTKRVSFADGYKPGQDSDVEDPPIKKRKRSRRVGCAWPCPATHPDHVPLWDALPPPPPPAGSPPPPARPAPPTHLLRPKHHKRPLLPLPQHLQHKFDPTSAIPNFMPPEPPPGLISFP